GGPECAAGRSFAGLRERFGGELAARRLLVLPALAHSGEFVRAPQLDHLSRALKEDLAFDVGKLGKIGWQNKSATIVERHFLEAAELGFPQLAIKFHTFLVGLGFLAVEQLLEAVLARQAEADQARPAV